MKFGERHRKEKERRVTLAFLLTCVMLCWSTSGLAESSTKVNWSAWTRAMLGSPQGQLVQSRQSEKLTAQWLASKAALKMAAVGIVPTTGTFDQAKNWLGNLGSGTCGDVAVILQDVFETARIGQVIPIEARVAVENDAAFQSHNDPFGNNTGHGVLALSLDGEVYAFDPWMDSYSESLLSGERWSYGHFQTHSKWNAKPVAQWWNEMQEAGYTRFWVGLPGYDGVSSQQHTNPISGLANIKAACTEYLESKGNQNQHASTGSDQGSWIGTWTVTSYHESGPDQGGRYTSKMEVVATDRGNYVHWNENKWPCVISGNTLTFQGRHPSGGAMNWIFKREGNRLLPEGSRFHGTIRGKAATGRYEGHKE
jgi:hypothetical protein